VENSSVTCEHQMASEDKRPGKCNPGVSSDLLTMLAPAEAARWVLPWGRLGA
jgi:hypothetical protein